MIPGNLRKLWIALASIGVIAALLGLWAWIDFLSYQNELQSVLKNLPVDADFRAAEAQTHAAGFAYGTMLFAAFGLVASVVGIVVVGLTLKATTDLALHERRPWLSIINVKVVRIVRTSATGKAAKFRICLEFDVVNNGQTAATDVFATVDAAEAGELSDLRQELHDQATDEDGALANIAPSRSQGEIGCEAEVEVDPFDHIVGATFVGGIRLCYAAGGHGRFESSIFFKVALMGATDTRNIRFDANGAPIIPSGFKLDYASVPGGRMN